MNAVRSSIYVCMCMWIRGLFAASVHTLASCCPSAFSCTFTLSLSLSLVLLSFYLCFWVWLMLPASQSTQSWGALLILFFWHVFFCAPIATATMLITAYSPKCPNTHTHTHNNGAATAKVCWHFVVVAFVVFFRLFCSICMYVWQHTYICACVSLSAAWQG